MARIDDEAFVRSCMALAAEAAEDGDPPFGALLAGPDGLIIARARNRQVSSSDPTAHAEIDLLRAAAANGHLPPLTGCRIVVNAEPCSMCASAIVKAGISELVFGAPHEPHMDPDLSVADVFARARHPPRVSGGVLATDAAAQIAAARLGAPPVD